MDNKLYGKKLPDGTGTIPSVDENCAKIILNYIDNVLKFNTITDCGTGMGWLVRVGNGRVIGIEGHELPILNKVCEQDILHGDLLNTDFIKTVKKSDLCTSFEVIEHICEEDLIKFFNNISLISDYLLCSIHIGTDPIPGHVTIKTENWWKEFFDQNNINYEKVNELGALPWGSSIYYLLNLNQIKKIDE